MFAGKDERTDVFSFSPLAWRVVSAASPWALKSSSPLSALADISYVFCVGGTWDLEAIVFKQAAPAWWWTNTLAPRLLRDSPLV